METEPWKAFGLELQDLASRGDGPRGQFPEFLIGCYASELSII
jgi:hypothetical protein